MQRIPYSLDADRAWESIRTLSPYSIPESGTESAKRLRLGEELSFGESDVVIAGDYVITSASRIAVLSPQGTSAHVLCFAFSVEWTLRRMLIAYAESTGSNLSSCTMLCFERPGKLIPFSDSELDSVVIGRDSERFVCLFVSCDE